MSLNALWLVLALLPLYVLVPWAPFAGPINTNDLLPVVGGLAAALSLWISRRSLPEVSRPWGALILLGLMMVLSHWVNDADNAVLRPMARTLGRLGLFAVIGAGITLIQDQKAKSRILRVFVAIVVFQAALGIAATLTGWSGPLGMGVVDYAPGHFPQNGWARAQGTFGGVVPAGELFVNRANFFSAYLTIGLFVALHALRKNALRQGACVVLCLAGIVASGSRMSLLASLLGLVVYTFLQGKGRSVIMLGGAVCLGVLGVPTLRERFTSGITDRLTLWEQAILVIQEAPWLGVGDGRYLDVLATLVADSGAVLHTPHHSILYAAATYGIPVAVALGILYGWLLFYSYQCRATHPALGSMTLAFILHDMTNNLFFVPEVALSFWIAWALLAPRRVSDD